MGGRIMKLCPAEETLPQALTGFDFGGEIVGAVRYGKGHINDTFCVYTQNENGDCIRFILQRINTNAFRNPEELMKNIIGVTEHLRQQILKNGGNVKRETMTVLLTKDGSDFYQDTQGGCWRVYPFVEQTICLQHVEKPEQFYESAKAFGQFQRLLADYDAPSLFETIPLFHDTRNRFLKFQQAVEKDALSRVKQVQSEIDFVLAHEKDCAVLMDLLESGKLPLRVTHNDTKLNNILMDQSTETGLCVIDLDTVMPGLVLNDFGDSIRFGANHSAEDETDLSKVQLDLDLFDIYTKGFLESAGSILTDLEKEYLPWGAKLMTLECGIRFLTDYLEGDHYFRTHYETQNLDRCRTQFKLVRDMEEHWQELQQIVAKYC